MFRAPIKYRRGRWINCLLIFSFLRRFFGAVVVVDENAHGGPVQVIELAGFQRPKKSRKADQSEEQSRRNEKDENVHVYPSRMAFRRSAFRVTTSDDDDMAMAATRGVARPKTANGTAMTL